MDPNAVYHFIFETYAGIGLLIAAGIVISIVYCVIAERKTRRVYKDKGERTGSDNGQGNDPLVEDFEEGAREGYREGQR